MTVEEDHWHPLLRARAIENQCYVLAPAQIGHHEPNAHCYGHSLVVDPWGTVIAESPNQEGVIVASLDLQVLREIRVQLPSLANRRLACPHVQSPDDAMNRVPRTPVSRHVVAEEIPL